MKQLWLLPDEPAPPTLAETKFTQAPKPVQVQAKIYTESEFS
jgi:hypothetical protein